MFGGTDLAEAYTSPDDMSGMAMMYETPKNTYSTSQSFIYNPEVPLAPEMPVQKPVSLSTYKSNSTMESFVNLQPADYPPARPAQAPQQPSGGYTAPSGAPSTMMQRTPQLSQPMYLSQAQATAMQAQAQGQGQGQGDVETMHVPAQAPVYTPPVPTFFDRMSMRRGDVARLVVLSFVVLLAIAMDKVLHFYLQEYLTRNILSDGMEMLVRAAYPLGVLLVLWMVKSL